MALLLRRSKKTIYLNTPFIYSCGSCLANNDEALPGVLGNKGTCPFILMEQGNNGKHSMVTREQN